MSALIADLLALSRAGHIVSDVKSVASREVVKTAVSGFSKMIHDRGIELVVSHDLPPVRCDEKALRQVFENLISNAVKYTKGVDEPGIEIRYESTLEEHVFCVKDNGSGIDPKHHDHIFGIFSRLQETDQEEGTGLGLAIVKKIVTNHGGRVWVDSRKGQGSAFYFTLPKGS
jgi:signal transduction histidine kinase